MPTLRLVARTETGATLEVTITLPATVVDTTAEPVSEPPRPALARCPAPTLALPARSRGHLRLLRGAA